MSHPSIKYYSRFIYFFILTFMTTSCLSQTQQSKESDDLRIKMVENQIVARGVKDERVIKAMKKIERHLFVPPGYQSQAYNDYPLPIGDGQTISQPYIVALMTEMLKPEETDKVLEIGTGSGYQAAILAEICDSVYTIEIFESLGKQARQLLTALGYKNIQVKIGDGYQGWPEYAPFDGIIATCAPMHIPEAIENQLAEGGRLVIPVGERNSQVLKLFVKKNNKLRLMDTVPVRFVPMINEEGDSY